MRNAAQVTDEHARELIALGAVYLGERIKGQDKIKWRRAIQISAANGLTSADDVAEMPVREGKLIRVHPDPKRFTQACYRKDWPQRVLYMDSNYLVSL